MEKRPLYSLHLESLFSKIAFIISLPFPFPLFLSLPPCLPFPCVNVYRGQRAACGNWLSLSTARVPEFKLSLQWVGSALTYWASSLLDSLLINIFLYLPSQFLTTENVYVCLCIYTYTHI